MLLMPFTQYLRKGPPTGSPGEPASKALHLTLAYQYPLSQFSRLEGLVKALDQRAAATWEVRLYSRDTRILGNEVRSWSLVPLGAQVISFRALVFLYVPHPTHVPLPITKLVWNLMGFFSPLSLIYMCFAFCKFY